MVGVAPDGAEPVSVVPYSAPSARRTRGRAHRMGIVETDQAPVGLIVQRQRIVDTVRFLRRGLDPLDPEPDPVFPCRIDNRHLAVKVEQGVETAVADDKVVIIG